MTTPEPPKQQRLAIPRNTLVLLAVVAVILVIFAFIVDWTAVWEMLLYSNKWLLLAASAALVAGLLFYAARWRLLLANKVPFWTTFHAGNIGLAANILIPMRAGEPLRIYVIGRDPNNPASYAEATSSVVAEKIFEQIMRLCALGLALGMGVRQNTASLVAAAASVLLAFLALWWILNHQERVLESGTRWLAKLPRVSGDRAHQVISDMLGNLSHITSQRQLVLAFLWSAVTWFSFWLFFYLTIAALGDAIPREDWLEVSLASMALSPPSAPTQPGLFHASIIVPLSALGFSPSGLTAFTIVAHILEMFWMIGLAVLGMLRMGISTQALLNAAGDTPDAKSPTGR